MSKRWRQNEENQFFIDFEESGGGPSSGYRLFQSGSLFHWVQDWHQPKRFKRLNGFFILRNDDYFRVFDSEEEARKVIKADNKNRGYFDLTHLLEHLEFEEDEGEDEVNCIVLSYINYFFLLLILNV